MLGALQKILRNRLFALSWTVITVILLCLPGSMVTGAGLFGIPNLDKIVHIILFGANVLFWGLYFKENSRTGSRLKPIILMLVFLAILLGIIMEFVQLHFIPNRSFDGGDIVADAIGAIAAGIWLLRSNG